MCLRTGFCEQLRRAAISESVLFASVFCPALGWVDTTKTL